MSRFLASPPKKLLYAAATDNSTDEDQESKNTYMERVVKYVPAEVLAAYIFASNMLSSYAKQEHRITGLFVLLAVCLVAIPLYYQGAKPKNKSVAVHMGVSIIAFLVWAYAMGGPFITLGWHHPATSGLILVGFTLLSGKIKP